MVKKFYLVLSFLLISFVLSFSQNKRPFNLNFDYSTFRLDSVSKYVELYYSYRQADFNLVQTEKGLKGGAIITARLRSLKNDSIIFIKKWKAPFIIEDTTNFGEGKIILGATGYAIPFGEYALFLKGEDEFDLKKNDSLEFHLKINNTPVSRPWLSDPEIASSIRQIPKDDKNIFYKNTLEVTPNPSLIFGSGLPMIFVYQEIYGLTSLKGNEYKYNLELYNVNSVKVKSISKTKKKLYESSVEVAQINCSDLSSGTYVLRCSLTDDLDSTLKVLAFKKVYIYNPHIAIDKQISGSSLIANEYGLMSDEDLNREFQIAKYLANKNEVDNYSKLTSLDSKRNFLNNFWRNRDDDPNTPENPAKDKFLKAISHCNSQFRAGMKEGWRSDRGRIWITYGQPDEIERHPNEIDSKPYEIWYFNNIEGGVIFVFIDRGTMGDYILVHSTYRNEIRDDSWQRLLK